MEFTNLPYIIDGDCLLQDAINNFGDVVAFTLLLAAGNYDQPYRVPYQPIGTTKAASWSKVKAALTSRGLPFMELNQSADWMFKNTIGEA